MYPLFLKPKRCFLIMCLIRYAASSLLLLSPAHLVYIKKSCNISWIDLIGNCVDHDTGRMCSINVSSFFIDLYPFRRDSWKWWWLFIINSRINVCRSITREDESKYESLRLVVYIFFIVSLKIRYVCQPNFSYYVYLCVITLVTFSLRPIIIR